jgi:hypothetical protein
MSIAKENTVASFDNILDRIEALCDNMPAEGSTSTTEWCKDLAEDIDEPFTVVYAVVSKYLDFRDDMEVVKGPGGGLRRKTAEREAARQAAANKLAALEAKRVDRALRKAEAEAKRAAKKSLGSANAFAKPAEVE